MRGVSTSWCVMGTWGCGCRIDPLLTSPSTTPPSTCLYSPWTTCPSYPLNCRTPTWTRYAGTRELGGMVHVTDIANCKHYTGTSYVPRNRTCCIEENVELGNLCVGVFSLCVKIWVCYRKSSSPGSGSQV